MSRSRSQPAAAALLCPGPSRAWKPSPPRRSSAISAARSRRPAAVSSSSASTRSTTACCSCAPRRTCSCSPGAPTSSPTAPRISTRSAAGRPATPTGRTCCASITPIRPKPKGRPTYRLVTQMEGQHGYLRRDAAQGAGPGAGGQMPASWRPAEENAAVEVWLTIDGATAVCGLRLSDRTMRHRTYKLEHRPASLRPTLAAAMVRLAEIRPRARRPRSDVRRRHASWPNDLAADADRFAAACRAVWGGDLDFGAVRAAGGQPAPRRPRPAGAVGRDAAAAGRRSGSHRVQSALRQAVEQPEAIGPLYAACSANTTASCGRADRPCCWSAPRRAALGGPGGRLETTAPRDRPRFWGSRRRLESGGRAALR